MGQTKLTNAEFADPTTGKGLVLDVWVSMNFCILFSLPGCHIESEDVSSHFLCGVESSYLLIHRLDKGLT